MFLVFFKAMTTSNGLTFQYTQASGDTSLPKNVFIENPESDDFAFYLSGNYGNPETTFSLDAYQTLLNELNKYK